jgi:hypothetical protein
VIDPVLEQRVARLVAACRRSQTIYEDDRDARDAAIVALDQAAVPMREIQRATAGAAGDGKALSYSQIQGICNRAAARRQAVG